MKDVRVSGLCKRFGDNVVVDNVSFELAAGQLLTLLGPSGCGKTTTLRLLAGLERPDSGTIEVGGRLVASGQHLCVPPEKRAIGMVFQSYAIWPHKTVFKNVSFVLESRKVPKREIRDRVCAALEVVGLGGLEGRPATLLSGGQQQRVAFARALVWPPDLLLLDEPLSNLDASLRDEMRFELKSLQSQLGLTTIFVTHDQTEAMALSDQVVVMNSGKIEQQAMPREVYERPKTKFVMDFLGHVNYLRGRVSHVATGGLGVVVQDSNGAHELLVPGSEMWHEGDEIVIGFRPEAVSLHAEGDVGELHGVIKAAVYLGDRTEYLVSLGDAVLRLASAANPQYEVGVEVSVSIDPSEIRTWPGDPMAVASNGKRSRARRNEGVSRSASSEAV